ncbi:BQ2448_5377 [Microbotryum intermedium]|uniref:BQ2448_5377 protein n=1 Tax=Microbotryum intermedium TaxID=269621 RepID=A0A238F9L2_9BASI|nr:BQ2448_5377 [Microbotryum intermedium]
MEMTESKVLPHRSGRAAEFRARTFPQIGAAPNPAGFSVRVQIDLGTHPFFLPSFLAPTHTFLHSKAPIISRHINMSPISVNGSGDAPRRASVSVGPIQILPGSPPLNPAQVTSPLFATSPPTSALFGSPPQTTGGSAHSGGRSLTSSNSFSARVGRALAPFPINESPVRVLLLENVNTSAVDLFKAQGYLVDEIKWALGEEELITKLRQGGYQAVGIRSKTKVTAKVISEVPSLLVIGCFCIGTNQVDLIAAAKAGIPVFNSPFSNSRSVAELVISEVIALSRQLCDRSREMREGIWNKVSKGCWEIRGKCLGVSVRIRAVTFALPLIPNVPACGVEQQIVGYGHIGSQLSVLAEAMGMSVLYYDVIPIMPLGSAKQVDTLEDLLGAVDFLSLHVPELPETTNLISDAQLSLMKDGAYLLNNARGKVVDIPALVRALQSGKLAGAAIDVFPSEPAANGPHFGDELNAWATELRACPNVIMTPHVGGSTQEAQWMIGAEVGSALIRYINYGSSIGAVNFPEVSLPPILSDGTVRLCHVHLNQPGVLKIVNSILGEHNVEKQFSDSKGDTAYLLADISHVDEAEIKEIYEAISSTRSNIVTRMLF